MKRAAAGLAVVVMGLAVAAVIVRGQENATATAPAQTAALPAVGDASAIWRNPSESVEARAKDLLPRLTLEEKISLLHADSQFGTAPLARFGVGRRWMSDGPQGVREEINLTNWQPAGRNDDFATAMPADIALAASFDVNLAHAYGNVIGEEAKVRGKQIMLGPGLNIMRTPLNGRNSEYFGEDPYLAGRMAVGYITAVQAHGVASCAKHFALNNQETRRDSINVEADDRALHEIYLPAFKAAVTEAHVLAIMTAYNKFRGDYCSENDLLLNQILKKDWHFQGLVLSDWGGVHSTVKAALNGMDLEMGTTPRAAPGPGETIFDNYYFAKPLLAAVKSDPPQVPPARIDEMALRNLRVMVATGMFDPPGARATAAGGGAAPDGPRTMVAPPGIPPPGGFAQVTITGPDGKPMTLNVPVGPGGVVSIGPINGARGAMPPGVIRGVAQREDPAQMALLSPQHLAAAREVAESGIVLLKNKDNLLPIDQQKYKSIAVIGANASARFAHDGNSAAIKTRVEITPLEGIQRRASNDVSVTHAEGYAIPRPGLGTRRGGRASKPPAGEAATQPNPLLAEAVNTARNADVTIIVAGLYRSQDQEGADRRDMNLPPGQLELIQQVLAVNPRTIVVLTGGGPVNLHPWLDDCPALLMYWYGGSEGGTALARVLFGDVNPSGHLPCSYPSELTDSPAHATRNLLNFPGENGQEDYAEGIFVGYRWFDAKNIQPLFPFGFGLSYTTFALSQPVIEPGNRGSARLTCFLRNTGSRPGAEVVQLYVEPVAPKVDRPVRELKGFKKLMLDPQMRSAVSFNLTAAAFSYYDPAKKAWVAGAGDYRIKLGTSSRDLPLSVEYHLAETVVTPDAVH